MLKHPLMDLGEGLRARQRDRHGEPSPAILVDAGHLGYMTGGGRPCHRAINPVLLVYRREEVGTQVSGFGGAQKQKATRTQGKVKHLQNLALGISIQINQQIAAADQMQMGKGRIAQQAVLSKEDLFADFLLHLVMRLIADEILAQPRRCNVGENGGRINPRAAYADRALINIGTKYLNLDLSAFQLHLISQQHGQ